jgi:hypothetical protein
MKVPTSEVIVVRRLSWEGEPNREVLVTIGKPAQPPDSQGQFYSPIHTVGLGKDEIVTAIFGVDSFQAIELPLQIHRVALGRHQFQERWPSTVPRWSVA